jgi:hypothetical protein
MNSGPDSPLSLPHKKSGGVFSRHAASQLSQQLKRLIPTLTSAILLRANLQIRRLRFIDGFLVLYKK